MEEEEEDMLDVAGASDSEDEGLEELDSEDGTPSSPSIHLHLHLPFYSSISFILPILPPNRGRGDAR